MNNLNFDSALIGAMTGAARPYRLLTPEERALVAGQGRMRYPVQTEGYQQTVPAGAKAARISSIGGKTVVWNQMVGATKQIPESGETYQKTVPAGAVAAEIGSIGGKTVVWNQQHKAPTGSASYWDVYSGTGTFENGTMIITGAVGRNGVRIASPAYYADLIAGHKYYIRFNYKTDVKIQMNFIGNLKMEPIDNFTVFEAIVTREETTSLRNADIFPTTTGEAGNYSIRGIIAIDLTQMFGAGNEPADTSDPRIAAILAYAEAHPEYDAGSLLSAEVTSVVSKDGDAETLNTLVIPAALRAYLTDKGYGWSAGSVYNELNLETKKYIQRVGSVDLGTLNYQYNNKRFTATILGVKPCDPSLVANVLSQLYNASSYYTADANHGYTVGVFSSGNIVGFGNPDFTDASAFKTAMNGVYLYYELAEPVEYDISSYLTDDNTLTVEPGGSLTFEQTATQLPVPVSLNWEKTAWTETLDSAHKYIYVEDGTETYISGAASQAIAGTDRGLIDLTRMFGVGSEPADLTEKQSRYALDYRAENPEKNAGELVSATVTDVTSFRNFWDRIGYAVKTGTVDKILKPSDQIAVPISSGGATPVDYNFDVLGIDEDEPVDPALSHVLTIQAHDVLDYGNIPFDPPQYLFAVTAEACAEYGWPTTGMPAGSYNITLDHGSYVSETAQDGTYQFSTTQVVPVGGGIRHTQIGVYRSDGDYSKANLLAGTFTTYAADRTTALESGLVTTEGSDGTSLGTTTAYNPTYKVGSYINFSKQQGHSSGRWSTSFLRQYLNSDEATMTFVPATIWSRPMTRLPEGFLYKLPESLKAVLGKVRKRYALNISDGYGYEDIEDTVNIVTMLDVNLGKNSNVSEGPVSADGAVTRETPYTHWVGATNADRIKYQGTTVRSWRLGSTNPPDVYEHGVNSSGALYNYYRADSSNGVVPSLHITGNNAAPLGVLEVPDAIQALEGYGESEVGGTANMLDLAKKTYTEIGHYVDGVWTPLDTPVVTDVSAYLSDNALEVETGGTVTFVQSNELKLEVPSKVVYSVKRSEIGGVDDDDP